MIENYIDTLKIHKLTQEQYETALANGQIDEHALYLTPDGEEDRIDPVALREELDIMQGILSNVVNIHEDQTITGIKTFEGGLAIGPEGSGLFLEYDATEGAIRFTFPAAMASE